MVNSSGLESYEIQKYASMDVEFYFFASKTMFFYFVCMRISTEIKATALLKGDMESLDS